MSAWARIETTLTTQHQAGAGSCSPRVPPGIHAVNLNATLIRRQQGRCYADGRGLSSSIVPKEADDLAARNGEAQVVNGQSVTESPGHPA